MDLTKKLKENNVSKADLARHFDVHWNTVNNWCKNPNNLKLSLIDKINSYLGGESEI